MKSFKLLLVLILLVNLAPVMVLAKLAADGPRQSAPLSTQRACGPAGSTGPSVRAADAPPTTPCTYTRGDRAREACAPVGLIMGFRLSLLLFFPVAAYLFARAMTDLEEGGPAPTAAPSAPAPAALDSLRQGTASAGGFVILDHAAEDLELPAEQVDAAVDTLRREDPTLEHRQVAGRWILRRPRL